MLSIGRLSGPDSERYYLDKVAKGREDYYAGRGEMPGRWAGSGVDLLMETDAEVSGEQFAAILKGQSPATGEPLGNASERSVHGFDLTFRAPKSVSLMFGVGDPRVSDAVRAGHELAVDEALSYLEREACWTRRGKGGKDHVRGEGFVAAAFRHRTSRAGDPLLHTHVVIANVTHANDKWTALDSRQLYRHAKTAGYLYQAALRSHLTQTLGVDWEIVRNGTADVVGVSRSVIEHFSQRRAEILEYMAERREHSAKAAQVATLQTRKPKQDDIPIDRLRADWRARAVEHGFGPAELDGLLDRAERFPADAIERARLQLDAPLPELTEASSTFDRRDVLQAWAERHRAGARVADIETLADQWLGTTQATPVEPDQKPHMLRRYSTPEMLHLEAKLVETSRDVRGCGAGQVPKADVAASLNARPELGAEQAEMVRALTTSGDGVQVIRAAAGTGKTYALDAAREIWEQADYQVVGCALSARAAVELQDQTGIPSTTIAKIRQDLQHGHMMSDRAVLIVDEAGMAGTRALAELADSARQTKVNRSITEGRRSFLSRYADIGTGAECRRWEPVLSALVDGEATAKDLAGVRPHLRNCPACRQHVRVLRESSAGLAALLPVPALLAAGADAPEPGFFTRVAEAITGPLHERIALAAGKLQSGVEAALPGKFATIAVSAAAVAGGGVAVERAVTAGGSDRPASSQRSASAAKAASAATARGAVGSGPVPAGAGGAGSPADAAARAAAARAAKAAAARRAAELRAARRRAAERTRNREFAARRVRAHTASSSTTTASREFAAEPAASARTAAAPPPPTQVDVVAPANATKDEQTAAAEFGGG